MLPACYVVSTLRSFDFLGTDHFWILYDIAHGVFAALRWCIWVVCLSIVEVADFREGFRNSFDTWHSVCMLKVYTSRTLPSCGSGPAST